MQSRFKKENSFEKRKDICTRMLKDHKYRIPVIVETENSQLTLNEYKFLVPDDRTVGSFLYEIRKRTTLRPEEALFLFCSSNVLIPISSTMSQIYEKFKDDDGFLYITVALENTFGNFYYLNLVFDNILKNSAKLAYTVGLTKF